MKPTVEQLEAIVKRLMKRCSWDDDVPEEISVKVKDEHTTEITVSCMYEKPMFREGTFLTGLVELRDACGAKDLDIADEVANRGCESCDYGSDYGYVFKLSY